MSIIAFMRSQQSFIMSIGMPSMGFIVQTMPAGVISQVIWHIIIGMPIIIGFIIMGFIMPPIIMGFIMPIMGFIMPFIIMGFIGMFIIGFIGMPIWFIGIPIGLIGICIAGIIIRSSFSGPLACGPTARSAHSAVLATTDLMTQS